MADESTFKNKLIRAFGLEELDEDDYNEYEDGAYYPEEEGQYRAPEQAPAHAGPRPVSTGSVAASRPQSAERETSADVLVLDPTTFDEAPGIVNKLKQDKTIVVNLKQTDFEEGRKIFDFLSGAVFALEGSLNRIAESVFILAPKLISVSTQLNDEPVENDEEILTWEETN